MSRIKAATKQNSTRSCLSLRFLRPLKTDDCLNWFGYDVDDSANDLILPICRIINIIPKSIQTIVSFLPYLVWLWPWSLIFWPQKLNSSSLSLNASKL